MSDFAYHRLDVSEVAARIRSNTDTLIIFHRHPDGDAVGSAFGLRVLLENMGCRVFCVCEDEIPARLRFLVEGAQESVLTENLPADFTPDQIIAVDTASPSQMGSLYEMYQGKVDLMIDHHGRGEMYADGWIDPQASATGKMLVDLADALMVALRLPRLPKEASRLLYAAISADTGCFRYSNTTPATHHAAAYLLGDGFDAADINHRLFGVKSADLLRAERIGYDRMRLFHDGRLGVVDMPNDVKRAHGLTDEHLETLVDIPRSLEGVEVAVAIRQPTDAPVYRASMRVSAGNVDVSEICAAFGGGGHKKAAGCTITDEGGMESVIATVVAAVGRAMGVRD